MAKKTKKNAEDPEAANPSHETAAPPDQTNAEPAAPAAKKKSKAARKESAPGTSQVAGPAAAEDAGDETGPPVVSKKTRAAKKKSGAQQPELAAVASLAASEDAGAAVQADSQAAEIEALAQAADAFEEAYEERIPTQRRPNPIEPAPSATAESSVEIVSSDAEAELVAPKAGHSPETLAHASLDDDEDTDDLDTGDDLEDEEDLDDEEDEDEDLDGLDEEDDEDLDEDLDDEDDDEAEDEDEEDEDEEKDEGGEAPARPEPNLQRLQKILSQAGIASRRHAEELITEGRVQVNGQVVTELGSKADPARDHIRVDGKLLHGAERLRYFMLNKPRGYVTTVSDPEGRPTVMEFVAKQGERLYPVGRLDYLSEGLLLMTNDGDLANKLTRAAAGVEKVYLVKVSGEPTEEELERLRSGVSIAKGKPGEGRVHTAPAQIRKVRQGDNPWYEVVLVEGRNRELRKMFEEIGHFVEKIRRVGYGPLVLDVEPGQIRELEAGELDLLRRAAEGKWKPRPRPKPQEARRTEDSRPPRKEGGFKQGGFAKRSFKEGGFQPRGDQARSGQDRPPRREGGASSTRPARFGGERREGRPPQFGTDRPPRAGSERRGGFADRGESRGDFRGKSAPRPGSFRPDRPQGRTAGEAPTEDFRARRGPAGQAGRGPRRSDSGEGRSFSAPREGTRGGREGGRETGGFGAKRPPSGGRNFRDQGDRSTDNRRGGSAPRSGPKGRFGDAQDRRRPAPAPRDLHEFDDEPRRPSAPLHIEEITGEQPRAPRPDARGPRPGGYAGRGGNQGSRSGARPERGGSRGFGDRPRSGGGDRPRSGSDRPRTGASDRPQGGRPGFKGGSGKTFGGGPARKGTGSRGPSAGRRPGASGGGRGNNRGPGNRGPSRGRS